jgi:hypothetical protein
MGASEQLSKDTTTDTVLSVNQDRLCGLRGHAFDERFAICD